MSLSSGCGSQTTSNGRVDVPVMTDGGANIYSFTQAATTSANAHAGMGSLGAYSKSEATSTPEAYLYTTNGVGGITEDEYVAGGNSSATSYWYDQLTVGGTPNANGYVVLQFSLDLHGQTYSSLPGSASASIASRLFIDDGYRYTSAQILGLGAPGTVSDTIGFRPGQQIQIYGDLMASSNAAAGRKFTQICNFFCYTVRGDYVSGSNAVADAANTAGFRIDVVTPDGSYSTLSTQSYLTAVPVPGAVWLLGSGLLGLTGVARRKHSRGSERHAE
ncbi:MAG: VPLPA-CTERM sorting domain-containing protein [Gammaproteobacteria bacterium]